MTRAANIEIGNCRIEVPLSSMKDLRDRQRYGPQLGLTAWLAEGLYIEPSVAFGLNGPADSVVFGRTIPYAFVP